MTRFDQVKEILDAAVGDHTVHGHGAFWRGKTRDEFVNYNVFGSIPLLVPGNGAGSNLIRALKGEPPFGADIGRPDADFNRMPSRMAPVPAERIALIEQWIDEGCPDTPVVAAAAAAAAAFDDAAHVSYWREFDNWAMFNTPPAIQAALDAFIPVTGRWRRFVKGSAPASMWEQTIAQVAGSVRLLSARQAETVRTFYGQPPDANALLQSYERFGAGTLPVDPQRPSDPQHQMDGREMWFVWSAFADAATRLGVDQDFWPLQIRAILVGLMNDGLLRGRFAVIGFPPGPAVQPAIRTHVLNLPDAGLLPELHRRYLDSGL